MSVRVSELMPEPYPGYPGFMPPTGGGGTVGGVSAYPFLSDEWIEQARALRLRYEGQVPAPPVSATVNVVVTEIPHRDDLRGHIDSSAGQTIIEEGHLDGADLTLTVPYDTARAAFVTGDQQAVMQAFFAGRILVEGDVSKLMALQPQLAAPTDDALAREIHRELLAITAD